MSPFVPPPKHSVTFSEFAILGLAKAQTFPSKVITINLPEYGSSSNQYGSGSSPKNALEVSHVFNDESLINL